MQSKSVYLVHQLIPYIGNKRKLLPLIRQAVASTGLVSGTFLDLFAGSGAVSRLAKTMGFRVVANDWEPYSYYINSACIAQNSPPRFEQLGGLESAFRTLNSLEPARGYIATHYCPADTEQPDIDNERMFYTQENGRRIDAMREQIGEWKNGGAIDANEESVLLASLIFQAAYCSNTSGVFKGFHRGWGGSTKTAWYRIRCHLTLSPPVFFDNQKDNEVHLADAHALALGIAPDMAYLDPPYNQHQYGSNYHLLNTVALWDKPPINKWITPGSKSAIRKDWREKRRSPYCYRSTATTAFQELVEHIDARFILVSYSTDGIIPLEDMLAILSERGRLRVMFRRYKRYRVSSMRPSPRPRTVEFVAIIDTSTPRGLNDAKECIGLIKKQVEEDSLQLQSLFPDYQDI